MMKKKKEKRKNPSWDAVKELGSNMKQPKKEVPQLVNSSIWEPVSSWGPILCENEENGRFGSQQESTKGICL